MIKVLAILSYIGKGLLALLFVIAAFASSWFMSMFMGAAESGMEQIDMSQFEGMEGMENVSTEEMEQAGDMLSFIANAGSGLLLGIFLFFALLQVMAIIGVTRMQKMKRSGFILYAIFNGIFLLLLLLGGNLLLGVLTLAFIVLYGINLKHMTS